jgi:phosphatidylinositol glycan class N
MCYVAIFGTGNVASISSFEISSTYRFVTVFSPFVMTSLLLWKLTAPMVIVSSVYFGLTRLLRVPRPAVFLLVVGLAGMERKRVLFIYLLFYLIILFICFISTVDVMTLDFFYLVRDEGSWQEIGVSIGHFAICNTFIILQLILFCLSSLTLRLPSSSPLSPSPLSPFLSNPKSSPTVLDVTAPPVRRSPRLKKSA